MISEIIITILMLWLAWTVTKAFVPSKKPKVKVIWPPPTNMKYEDWFDFRKFLFQQGFPRTANCIFKLGNMVWVYPELRKTFNQESKEQRKYYSNKLKALKGGVK